MSDEQRETSTPQDDATVTPHPAIDLPPELSLQNLPPWERHLWLTPDLTVQQKEIAILLVRFKWGDLTDQAGLERLLAGVRGIIEDQDGRRL